MLSQGKQEIRLKINRVAIKIELEDRIQFKPHNRA